MEQNENRKVIEKILENEKFGLSENRKKKILKIWNNRMFVNIFRTFQSRARNGRGGGEHLSETYLIKVGTATNKRGSVKKFIENLVALNILYRKNGNNNKSVYLSDLGMAISKAIDFQEIYSSRKSKKHKCNSQKKKKKTTSPKIVHSKQPPEKFYNNFFNPEPPQI